MGDFQLREKNGQRHSGKNGEMKGRAGGGAQGFRRKRAGCAGLSGSGRDRSGGAEGRGRSQDRADVSWVLDARENYKQRSAGRRGCAQQFIESGGAWMDKCGDTLRMLGVGEAFEEAVSGAQGGKGYFWPADERSETFAMAFAGLAKEYGIDAATGVKGFFDESDAFDANGPGFGRQTATERQAEFFEPAVVPAGEDSRRGCGRSVTSGLFCGSHWWQSNKFTRHEGNGPGREPRKGRDNNHLRRCQSMGGHCKGTGGMVASPD